MTVSANYHFLNFIGDNLGGVTERPVSNSSTMRLEATPTNFTAGCDPSS